MKRIQSVLVKSCLCAILSGILVASPALAASANQRPATFGVWLETAQTWLSSWFAPTPRAVKPNRGNGNKDTTDGGTIGSEGTYIPVGGSPVLMPNWGNCIDPQGMCGT
jgi:hypothetical protein